MGNVLVVDDELHIRDFLRHVLASEGYDVLTVPSAAQAMDKMAHASFDLALIDIRLPDESGLSLLRRMRQITRTMPIVVYSGLLTPDLEKEARLAGANEVLSKAVGVATLTEQIRKFIKARNQTVSLAANPILLVDDEAPIRHMLKTFFKTKGYRVLEAENGKAGLSIIESTPVSVVLLDIEMPEMDGLMTLKKIIELKPDLGVVMVTGVQSDERVKRALEMGACDYVLKPFDLLYLELVVLSKISTASFRE